jgi:hypothetical protein
MMGLRDAAKLVGGDDYQRYLQASKAFEAQLMPIMSGAAVSPSEAQRQVSAALPEFMDSVHNLRLKSMTRKMMLNGAAHAAGAPIPYPEVGTFGVTTGQLPPAAPGQAPEMPAPIDSSRPAPNGPAPGTVEGGYRFKGGYAGDPANWEPVQAQ